MPFLDEQPATSPKSGFLDESAKSGFLDEPQGGGFLPGAGVEPTIDELKNLRDTGYQLSEGEFRKVYTADQARPVSDKVAAGAGSALSAFGNVLSDVAHRVVKDFTPGPALRPDLLVTDPRNLDDPRLNLAEGATRSFFDLGRLTTRGGVRAVDAVAPTGKDPVTAAYARYLQNYNENAERAKLAEGKVAPYLAPSGDVGINPNSAELASYVVDPDTLGVAGALRGVARKAGEKVVERGLQKSAEKTLGAVASGAGRVYEVAKAPIKAAGEKVGGVPVAGLAGMAGATFPKTTAAVTGTLGTLAGGAKTVQKAAEAGQQMTRTVGGSQFSRLQQIAMSETAPAWVRSASRNLSRLGVDDAAAFGASVAKSGATGAAVGGAISAPGAESPEEIGQGVGAGFGLGSLTHIALAPTVTHQARRAAEDFDIARWYAQKSDAERATLDKAGLSRDTALSLMDVEAIANGVLDPQSNIQFFVLPEAEYNASPLVKGVGEGTRGVSVVAGAKPTIVFNANRLTDGTAYHELGHILTHSPEIFDLGGMMSRLFGIHDAAGKQLRPGILPEGEFARRGEQYFQKFDPAAQQVLAAERNAYNTDPNSPAGQQWAARIAGEVMAELFANLGRATEGSVLKSATSLPRTIVDKMLLSDRSFVNKAGQVADKAFGAQRGESDILPGLQNTPEVDAALRQSIRNKASLNEAPTFDTKRMESEQLSFNPREVLKAGGDELLKKFADNDNFEKDNAGNVARGVNGAPILRSEQTIKKAQKARADAMLEALAASPDAQSGDPSILKPEVNAKTGQPDFSKWSGPKFSEDQLKNFDALPNNVLTPLQKAKIRELNTGPGTIFEIDYNAATKGGRYSSSISKTIRQASLLSLHISKAGNFYGNFLDLTAFNRKLADWMNTPSKKRAFADFNGSTQVFIQKVYEALANHQKGLPARTNLDLDPAKAARMADRINDFINIRDLASETSNPDRISGTSDKDKLIRSLRFDRMNAVKKTEGRFDIDQKLQKQNYSPDDVTENPNFRKWFGKSKFVDEAGKPRVMYRGDSLPFHEFDRNETRENGFFFTPDKRIADIYGRGDSRGYYIKAEKILDLTQDTPETRKWVKKWAESFDDWTDRRSGEPVDPFDMLQGGQMFDYEGTWSGERWKDIQATAENDGYDAVVLPDYDNDTGVFPSVVVFEPTHIKSIDNSGEFNPKNKDVRFSPDVDADTVRSLSPEDFVTQARAWKGGLTGQAIELGKRSSAQDVPKLQSYLDEAQKKAQEFKAARNFDGAMTEGMRGQFFREAIETIKAGQGEQGLSITPENLKANFSPTIKPPTDAGDEPGIKNAWVSPAGDIHPIGPFPTHDAWATVATGTSGNFDASKELYKKGWVRLVHYGTDAAMANTEGGRSMTPKQLKAIKDAAISSGKSKLWFDNQNSYKVVWSSEDDGASGRNFSPEGEKEANVSLRNTRFASGSHAPEWADNFYTTGNGTRLANIFAKDGGVVAKLYDGTKGEFPDPQSAKNWVEGHHAILKYVEGEKMPPATISSALESASGQLNKESGQYSQLERVINDKVQGQSIPAAQLAAMLRNPQSGVKAEEIKWTGLDDFLKGRERVTKSELLDFVRANRLQIEEKRLGQDVRSEAPPKWDEIKTKGQTLFSPDVTKSENFKAWFGDSKVRDKEGNPQVIYHGTGEKFTKFSVKKATQGIIWFTNDKSSIERGEAGAQGRGYVMDLYASIQNPAGWDDYHKLGLGELRARGYDGAILPEDDGTFTGFVFEPTQLKSASKNRGTFDPNNADIRYSPDVPNKGRDEHPELYSWLTDGGVFKPVKMNHGMDVKHLPGKPNADGVVIRPQSMEEAFKAGFARVTYAGRDLYVNKEGKSLTRAQKSALIDLAEKAGKNHVMWDNGRRLIPLWSRPDAPGFDSPHLYDTRGGAAYSPDTPPTRTEINAFREHLNSLDAGKHKNGRYQQRTRRYGDYLYNQDREKFNADLIQWRAERKDDKRED